MTRRRLVLLALSLYPSWWRARYGEEAAVILEQEQSPPTGRAALDLLRGALDAWTRQRPPREGFARFGDEARQVLVLAQKEARALDHDYVGTEHVLLGLLAAREGEAARALDAHGVSSERVRTRLVQILEQGLPSPPARCPRVRSRFELPKWSMCLTPRAKQGFALSCRAADRRGQREVDSAHLLLGLLDEGEGIGATILAELVDPARLRAQLDRLGGPGGDGA
jgi:ATP-dependent Clp protease ATP-binding subunit ClpC